MERIPKIPILYQRKKKSVKKANMVYTRKKEKIIIGEGPSRKQEKTHNSTTGDPRTNQPKEGSSSGADHEHMQGPAQREGLEGVEEKGSGVKSPGPGYSKMEGVGDSKDLEDLLKYFN